MTNVDISPIELLKIILLNLNTPQVLNDHPWAPVSDMDAGKQLVDLTLEVFRRMVPPSPPRPGKRLDTRWGAFSMLAALYFAPFVLRAPFPSSIRNSWDSLDRAILLIIYGKTDGLSEQEIARYRFAGNEILPAPKSTLNDWHRRGLEQLSEMMLAEKSRKKVKKKEIPVKALILKTGLALALVFLLFSGFLGFKAWGLYQRVQDIQKKVDTLEADLSHQPGIEQIPEAADKIHDLRMDIDALETESAPYLWLTKYAGWIPTYGGTLSQTDDLLIFTQNLIVAADDGLSAISPAIKVALKNDQPLEVMDLLLQLKDSSPKLLSAQIALAQVQTARERINAALLIPRLQNVITSQIDPLLTSINGAFPMEDALAMVNIAPELLGSGKTGPQSYLILMQNEDELRPTGGFLTAVGSVIIKDGKLLNLNIESSDLIDNFNKPYPIPPLQFKKFMNINMFLLRDSNWFTDFPTTVSWAEYFYSYSRAATSDGVIAFDMNVIAQLLDVLGPVNVGSVNMPITSKNIKEYLRSAEKAPPKGVDEKTWDRKQFIADLAKPVLEKILNARGKTWSELVPVMLNLLDEKHILLQFDNEEMTALLERRKWDGAVRIPEKSDFLMVVDTNMGYNKSNAVMETTLDYDVNLTNLAEPKSLLTVRQINHSQADVPCVPFAAERFSRPDIAPGEIPNPIYNIDECHWSYLRAYLPEGAHLLRSNPQDIPDTATMLGETIAAQTDDLKNEDILNAQVFGMMVLTPTRKTTNTEFEYSLPASVITFDEASKLYTYRLKVQKQPGTLANIFNFTLHLPEGYKIENATNFLNGNAGVWTAQLDLRQDLQIEIKFRAN